MNTSEPTIESSTAFRQEAPQTQETAPERAAEVPGVVQSLGDIPIAKDAPTNTLEVWETESRRRYGEDYFKIREVAHTFPIKAHFGAIDKYVKAELDSRGWEKSTQNYENIIQEIEAEIGSANLQNYKRLQRIFNYIQVVQKIAKLKEKQKLYQV